jgi:hypothetical protein
MTPPTKSSLNRLPPTKAFAPPGIAPEAPDEVKPPPPIPAAHTSNAVQTPSVRRAKTFLARRTHITTLVVPAGQTAVIPISGDRFQLLQSPCPVEIRYDIDAGFAQYSVGMGVRVGRKRPFSLLEVKNPLSKSAITIVIYVGTSELRCDMAPLLAAVVVEGFALMTGEPVVLSSSAFYFRRGFFYGYQGKPTGIVPVNNSAIVNMGRTANVPDQVQAGSWIEYDAPAGVLYNLANFTALGTGPDGLFWTLTQ